MQSRKSVRKAIAALIVSAAFAAAQQPSNSAPADRLKAVLDRLDRAAAEFRSAEASFEWDQYTRVTDETEKQQGMIYFRRTGGSMQMAANVTDPPPAKYVLYSGGKVQLYQANTDHLDVYDAGKSNGAVEAFLVLGFGGSGHDMLKSFDVTYGGSEKVNGTDTDKLELIPKTDKVKGMFNRIELWIDSRGISIQQKFITPEGDYRVTHYTNIISKKKIADSVFKIKTSGNTRIENH